MSTKQFKGSSVLAEPLSLGKFCISAIGYRDHLHLWWNQSCYFVLVSENVDEYQENKKGINSFSQKLRIAFNHYQNIVYIFSPLGFKLEFED